MQGPKTPQPKRKFKPRLRSKGKSYALSDSGLYNITTKKRLEDRLQKPFSELKKLTDDSNYRTFLIKKLDGSFREVEAPKLKLDIVQTRIASLLIRVAMPDYVHSGIPGRSNITNAQCHIGDHPLLTMDIRRFYPSTSRKSIYNFFRSKLKAAPEIAGILADLCSYKGSATQPHLPTGSRLSMPLAFWANYTMYENLYAFCKSKKITMTIYVDDLTFSGDAVNRSVEHKVKKIVRDAGLAIHPEKSRLYRRDEPKLVTGVIIDGSELKVRNKHHGLIYKLFNKLRTATCDKTLEEHQKIAIDTLQKQLLGRLSAAGQIDPAFKQRAAGLRRDFKHQQM